VVEALPADAAPLDQLYFFPCTCEVHRGEPASRPPAKNHYHKKYLKTLFLKVLVFSNNNSCILMKNHVALKRYAVDK
jgi:hypothetical protein